MLHPDAPVFIGVSQYLQTKRLICGLKGRQANSPRHRLGLSKCLRLRPGRAKALHIYVGQNPQPPNLGGKQAFALPGRSLPIRFTQGVTLGY